MEDAMSSGSCARHFCLTIIAGAILLHAQSGPVVVSAADVTIAPAPGSLATIYGVQLVTPSLQATGAGEAPTDLGGFTVEVGGKRSQLLFVSPAQINFVVPADVSAGDATVTVRYNGQVVAQSRTTVRSVSPAIFS